MAVLRFGAGLPVGSDRVQMVDTKCARPDSGNAAACKLQTTEAAQPLRAVHLKMQTSGTCSPACVPARMCLRASAARNTV